MSLSSPSSMYHEADMLCDWNSVMHKIENMKSVTARSNVFMDSKLMMLKLRRARLGAQLAYSRHQSLLAEVELRLADADLKYEMSRRRQFVTRSRIIRQTMKPFPSVASKEIQTIDIDDADDAQTTQTPADKVGKKDNVSSKRKRRTDKDRLSEEKTKNRVDTDETPCKATTTSKETNSKPNKKSKTDAETQSTDKTEKTSSEKDREKSKERRHGKKSSKTKTKTQDSKKSSTSNNKEESHNDKHKDKDETNDKSAKRKHDGQVKKPKSVSKYPPTKDACKSDNNTSKDQASKGIQTEEFSASCDMEKTPLSAEETNRETSEEKEVAQKKNNTDICTPNNCNLEKKDAACGPDFTDDLEVKDRNVVHQNKETGEAPENIIDKHFEIRAMKRERASSISSVETLKL